MAFTIGQIASYGAEYEPFGWEAGRRLVRYEGGLYAFAIDARTTSKIVMFTSVDNGANWTSEEIIDLASSTRSLTSHPNVIVDSLGTFHIVFRAANLNSGWDEICYVSGYSMNWGSLSILAAPEVSNLPGPDIAYDPISGNISVLWMEQGAPDYDVVLKVNSGAPAIITTAENAAWSPRIISGAAEGELHAVWLADPDADYSMALVYGYYDGATWDFTTFDPLDTGMSPEPSISTAQILLDGDGTVHIFFVANSNPDSYPSVFHYYNAGAGWVGPTLIREETTNPMFMLGSPTVDSAGVIFLPVSRCDTVAGDIDPPGSVIIYKYQTAVWSVAETFLCDTSYITKAMSLISPSNTNEGFIGVFDYGLVTDAYNWIAEYNPSVILAEVVVVTYHLEFYYDGQSQGNTDSANIFLPLVTDDEIYKLIGIKNVSGDPIQGIALSAASLHGDVAFALGSSGDSETDGKMKTYSENVFTPSVANNATTYVWMRWRNTIPRYVGSNTVQLTNVVY